jgi:hypothetical protein
VCVVCIVRGRRGLLCQAVTVYPLSLRGVTTEPEHLQDGTTRHTSVAVFGQGGAEPTDAGGSRDRVQAQSPNALGVVAVDGVTHQVVCC